MTHWTGAEWVATADAWVTSRLAAEGIAVTGAPVTYKVRFWAVVRFWFKENNLGQAFEAALVAAMARELPHHVVAPLAIDADRGWMLTPGGLDDLRWAVDRLDGWRPGWCRWRWTRMTRT